MTGPVIYFAPDTCARVSMIALEEAGLPYEARLVSFVRGDHRSPEFLALNPGGKVPVLLIDGEPLTENVAIISWVHATCPEAGLLPEPTGSLESFRQLSDLVWCASGLHPLVTRMRIPQIFCTGDDARDGVRARAKAAMSEQLARIDRKLGEAPWWYGDRWSILDAYLNWIWFRVTACGIDAADFPALTDHDARVTSRPSVRRVLDRHAEAGRSLAAAGLAVDFDRFGSAAAGTK